MTLDEWRFSTRLAWENPFLRWVSLGTAFFLLAVTTYAAIRLVGASLPSGYVVTHYTVYLGIDQVVPAYWLFAYLGVPIFVVSATILCGFGLYRHDSLAGSALVALALVSTAIWALNLFYLIKINI
jgi:hypothetical protein